MKKCIIPGTFDPITLGHVDMIRRASKIFDEVIVLTLTNPYKANTLFCKEDRIGFVKESVKGLNNVKIEHFDGLMIDYCKKSDIFVVVRGSRNSSDFDDEFVYFMANKSFDERLEFIILPSDKRFMHISSTLIREIIRYGGDLCGFVPDEIIDGVKNKIKN